MITDRREYLAFEVFKKLIEHRFDDFVATTYHEEEDKFDATTFDHMADAAVKAADSFVRAFDGVAS